MEIFEVRDSRDGFLWLSNSFFDNYIQHIQPTSIVIYLAIARMVNNQTQTCFPSYERLSNMTGMARSTVAIAIQELRNVGVVAWEKEGRKNVYRLLNTTSPKNGLFKEPVRSVDTTSPKNDPNQSEPSDSNKTINKTKEQNPSPPSVSSGNDLVLSPDNQTNHSSKQKKETDPRTAAVREMLAVFWNDKNSPDELYWEAADAAQLKSFLKRWPKRSVGDIARALGNYGDSEGIVETRTPKEFLPRLHLYFEGPLNRFNHPLGAKHASA